MNTCSESQEIDFLSGYRGAILPRVFLFHSLTVSLFMFPLSLIFHYYNFYYSCFVSFVSFVQL